MTAARTARTARSDRRAGFTLVELMVVLAIISILVGLSISILNGKPRAIDLAHDLSTRLGEASRKAVAAGAVRSDVALAQGSPVRTHVLIDVVAAGGGTLTTERLEEDPLPAATASWVELVTVALPKSIIVAGTRDAADLTGQGIQTALGDGDQIEIRCYPDGRCDGKTIYLQTTDHRRQARVAVLPLGGTPITFDSW
ncbi:MAG TPA: prepilin-type N-terminal cleavage/methylation domain-containing protein [Kofleriaceae bacterium]|nr:prepilin-type N-terminal cleavage/methylation domain-containing protein [Kofleriaceae bacterium]